jgi:hypothetical protein
MRELCDGRHENFAALVNSHSAGLSVQGPALAEAQPRSRLQWLNHPAPGFPVPGAGSYRSGQLYIRMLSGFAVEVEQISGHKATLANAAASHANIGRSCGSGDVEGEDKAPRQLCLNLIDREGLNVEASC